MKLIVLTGLVSVEKIELAKDLSRFFKQQDIKVAILDNIARLQMNPQEFDAPVQRISGDMTMELEQILSQIDSDVVILALSEQTHPDNFFITIDSLSDTIEEIDVFTLALFDLRTCDCFPNLRETLEQYANVSIYLPYKLDEVLNHVSHSIN